MSVTNAVHDLLDVAAGRRNMTPDQADQHHEAIDKDEAPAAPSDTESAADGGTQPATLPAPPYAPEAAQPAGEASGG